MIRIAILPVIAGLLIGSSAAAQTLTDPGAAPPSAAIEPVTADERIASLEEQVRELRTLLDDKKTKPSAVAVPKATKYPNIELNGMLHIDGGVVAQDQANIDLYGDVDNSLGFRRARIGVDGFITEHLFFRLVPDFALSGRPSFRDAYVEYRDLPGIGTIRLGESRQPFGMDAQTPASELLFLERSLSFALSPFRQTGLGFRNHNEDESVTWHGAVFGYTTDPYGNSINESGFGAAARSTAILWEDESAETLVHVGADYAYLHPADEGLRYRSVPEYTGLQRGLGASIAVMPSFVDTGFLDDATSNAFGLELAAVRGPLLVQGELVASVVELEAGDSATFRGAYAQAIYCLTGESHGYNREFGHFKRLDPKCPVSEGGCGAWELAARFSLLDLEDGPIEGGTINDLTLGVNWFLNRHTRLQFNYIHAWTDRAPVGLNEADIYASRLAVDF
ncbi:Porin O precursor [Caulifigura coniformis]|uniref:Porin O n=1 Tax=Caulifigura coniformis TaxID=2527983 RepID=A0A517SCI4_9PLAN|nr:porin [Caulifigura coniformis]QDT53842.1 Porin O precursor [Caulifigura coniformis]